MNESNSQLSSLIADFPRGRFKTDIGLPPAAHFESPENILATQSLRFDPSHNRESKIFLGVVGGEVILGDPLSDGRPNRYLLGGTPIGVGDDRHLLTTAGSRAGKGRSALIPNAIYYPSSLVCLDPKGHIASATARLRAIHQEVNILDPFEICGDHVRSYRCVFNALETLLRSDKRSFVPNAKLIADSLIVSNDIHLEHWDECSKGILAGLCAHVATYTNYAGRRDLVTAWELSSLLASRDPSNPSRFLLDEEMKSNDSAGGMIRAAGRAFYDRTGGEFSSVLSNLRKHLDWISIECTHSVLRGDSIDLRDLKKRFMTLFVTLPALRMNDLSGWLRLVTQLAFAAHEEETASTGYQTLFMLDEFSVLGRLKCAETAIAQLAGLGVKCWIVVQDLSQLKKNYPDNWETFVANSGVFQFFGGADDTTLTYVSKLLGDALTLSRASSSPTFNQSVNEGATGDSWSIGNSPLMTASELARFFGRDDKLLRQLILRPGHNGMVLGRAFYDKHEIFQGKYDEL